MIDFAKIDPDNLPTWTEAELAPVTAMFGYATLDAWLAELEFASKLIGAPPAVVVAGEAPDRLLTIDPGFARLLKSLAT